jgi:hypothetical protein
VRIIVTEPAVSRAEVSRWVQNQNPHDRFTVDMLPVLWWAARRYDVDPIGVVCQSGKETAWGRFPGAVRAWQHNTCGLRINQTGLGWIEDLRENVGVTCDIALHRVSHAAFATWHQGALAHVQHLLAYCGVSVPVAERTDPRFSLVTGADLVHWRELSGRWAPSSTYGLEIEAMITEIIR